MSKLRDGDRINELVSNIFHEASGADATKETMSIFDFFLFMKSGQIIGNNLNHLNALHLFDTHSSVIDHKKVLTLTDFKDILGDISQMLYGTTVLTNFFKVHDDFRDGVSDRSRFAPCINALFDNESLLNSVYKHQASLKQLFLTYAVRLLDPGSSEPIRMDQLTALEPNNDPIVMTARSFFRMCRASQIIPNFMVEEELIDLMKAIFITESTDIETKPFFDRSPFQADSQEVDQALPSVILEQIMNAQGLNVNVNKVTMVEPPREVNCLYPCTSILQGEPTFNFCTFVELLCLTALQAPPSTLAHSVKKRTSRVTLLIRDVLKLPELPLISNDINAHNNHVESSNNHASISHHELLNVMAFNPRESILFHPTPGPAIPPLLGALDGQNLMLRTSPERHHQEGNSTTLAERGLPSNEFTGVSQSSKRETRSLKNHHFAPGTAARESIPISAPLQKMKNRTAILPGNAVSAGPSSSMSHANTQQVRDPLLGVDSPDGQQSKSMNASGHEDYHQEMQNQILPLRNMNKSANDTIFLNESEIPVLDLFGEKVHPYRLASPHRSLAPERRISVLQSDRAAQSEFEEHIGFTTDERGLAADILEEICFSLPELSPPVEQRRGNLTDPPKARLHKYQSEYDQLMELTGTKKKKSVLDPSKIEDPAKAAALKKKLAEEAKKESENADIESVLWRSEWYNSKPYTVPGVLAAVQKTLETQAAELKAGGKKKRPDSATLARHKVELGKTAYDASQALKKEAEDKDKLRRLELFESYQADVPLNALEHLNKVGYTPPTLVIAPCAVPIIDDKATTVLLTAAQNMRNGNSHVVGRRLLILARERWITLALRKGLSPDGQELPVEIPGMTSLRKRAMEAVAVVQKVLTSRNKKLSGAQLNQSTNFNSTLGESSLLNNVNGDYGKHIIIPSPLVDAVLSEDPLFLAEASFLLGLSNDPRANQFIEIPQEVLDFLSPADAITGEPFKTKPNKNSQNDQLNAGNGKFSSRPNTSEGHMRAGSTIVNNNYNIPTSNNNGNIEAVSELFIPSRLPLDDTLWYTQNQDLLPIPDIKDLIAPLNSDEFATPQEAQKALDMCSLSAALLVDRISFKLTHYQAQAEDLKRMRSDKMKKEDINYKARLASESVGPIVSIDSNQAAVAAATQSKSKGVGGGASSSFGPTSALDGLGRGEFDDFDDMGSTSLEGRESFMGSPSARSNILGVSLGRSGFVDMNSNSLNRTSDLKNGNIPLSGDAELKFRLSQSSQLSKLTSDQVESILKDPEYLSILNEALMATGAHVLRKEMARIRSKQGAGKYMQHSPVRNGGGGRQGGVSLVANSAQLLLATQNNLTNLLSMSNTALQNGINLNETLSSQTNIFSKIKLPYDMTFSDSSSAKLTMLLPPAINLYFLLEIADTFIAEADMASALTCLRFALETAERLVPVSMQMSSTSISSKHANHIHHPDEALVWESIGRIAFHSACYLNATQCFMKVKSIREASLGYDAPATGVSYVNLGSSLFLCGRPSEARAFGELGANLLKATLGEQHVWTCIAKSNLDGTLSQELLLPPFANPPHLFKVDVPHYYSGVKPKPKPKKR